MSASFFSKTSLPPLVRVSDSGDAPFRVASSTALERPIRTLRIIGVRVHSPRPEAVSTPETATRIAKGRRTRPKHR